MPESIFAKLGSYIIDGLLLVIGALFTLLSGFLVYKWNRHEKRVDKITEDLSVLQKSVVYKSDLDAKAQEIKDEVKAEHQRIIDEQKESNKVMRDELITCNQNVMAHIATMKEDVREVRTMLMSLLGRRQGPR